MPLYMVLDPTKEKAANIELSCDQSGLGFTPMLGIDFKTGRWNFAAKYEFKTRIRLKNKSVNQTPSIGNLPDNLRNAYIAGGVPEQAADAILSNPVIKGAMGQLKTQFDSKLEGAIGEYEDGKKIAGDIPAYLAPTGEVKAWYIGVQRRRRGRRQQEDYLEYWLAEYQLWFA